ncbi:MAG: aldehyde reductase [Anaerolineales bacterium]
MTKNTTVLVTGASGFIAIHTIIQLLEQGYNVRGTLRTMKRETELRQTLAKFVRAGDRLSFTQADLLSDEGWDEAVRGCEYVLHMASPFPLQMPKDEDDLIRPAREGTLRVLKAAADNGVRRVVLTSSTAAVAYGHPREKRRFDESDWSIVDAPGANAYQKSKTLAERAAWAFMDNLPKEHPMELAVINPGLVLGPLPDTYARTSGVLVYELLKASAPGLARMHFNGVDVRDVAAAHLAAMTKPEAAGQRFICVSESFWMKDVALVLKKHFAARGFKVKTTVFPDWAVRIVALFNKEARATLDSLGREIQVDNSKIQKVLGVKFRDLEEMTVAMAESMIELGIL